MGIMKCQRSSSAPGLARTVAAAGSVAVALMFGSTSETMAASCNVSSLLRSLDNGIGSVQTTSTTASGTICGQSFTVTSPVALTNNWNNLGSQLQSVYGSLSSASFVFDGVPVTITVPGTFNSFTNSVYTTNRLSAVVNGRTLVLTTSDPTFLRTYPGFQSGTIASTFTLSVNGSAVYSGNSSTITIQNGLDLLAMLGIADSYSVVQQTIMREQSRVVSTMTTDRITAMLTDVMVPGVRPARGAAGGRTGVASGDAGLGIGVWFSPSNSWSSSSDPVNKFSGTLQNFLLGADYKVTPNLLGGIALGFENSSFATAFNSGTLGNQGISATPYFGLSMFDHRLIWNVMGGYTYNMGQETRSAFESPSIRGNFTGQRWMFSTNLTSVVPVADSWSVVPAIGFLAAWDHRFNFTESSGNTPLKNDSVLVEGRFGAKVNYAFAKADVFAGAYYLHDFIQDQDFTEPNVHVGRAEMQAIVGVNWFIDDRQTLTAEVSNAFFRQNFSQTTIQANYRITF